MKKPRTTVARVPMLLMRRGLARGRSRDSTCLTSLRNDAALGSASAQAHRLFFTLAQVPLARVLVVFHETLQTRDPTQGSARIGASTCGQVLEPLGALGEGVLVS